MMNCMNNLVKCGRVEEMNVYIDHCWDNCNIKNVNCDVLNLMTSSVKRGNVEEMTENINHLMQNVDVKDVNLNVFPTENEMSTLVKCNRIEEKTENIGNFQQHVKSDAFSIEHTLNISVKCDMLEEMIDNVDNFLHVCNIKDVNSDAFSIENQVINSVRCGQIKTMAENIDHFLHKDASSDDYSLENLVSTLVKCGRIEDALQIFYTVPHRTVFTWTTFIRGFTECGRGREALDLYRYMLKEGVEPNAYTFVSLFKACSHLCDLDNGKALHAYAQEKGLDCNIFVGNSLISMYGKCGDIAKAENVFYSLSRRDIVSWNALITGYVEHEQGFEALNCFEQMQREGIIPDAITFTCILKACGSLGMIDKGEPIHQEIVSRNLLKNDIVLGNALVDMYVKCAAMAKAQEVLENLPDRNVVTWSTLIAGYAQNVQCHEALKCFERMQSEGQSPNIVTLTCVLKACGSIRAIDQGKKIHDVVSSRGLLKREIVFGSVLVDMYTKCGELAKAQETLKELSIQNVVAWNALITGYTQQGQGREALNCFDQMQREGFSPNVVTFICILRTCGNIGAIDKGKEIHEDIASRSLLENDVVLRNALVDMYAKCGSCEDAREVFDSLPQRKIVSWNAVMTGYIQCGQPEEALSLFQNMQQECLKPDKITFMNVFKACGSLGYLSQAKEMHALSEKHEFEFDQYLENTLIDAYGKCGDVKAAKQVFDGMEEHDVISWNALISAHAQSGHVQETFDYLHKMLLKGQNPNHITYVTILSVCNHAGLVEEGLHHFDNISRIYGIDYTHEHYACMIDMLCRVGLLPEASQLTEKMPLQPSSIVWMTILGGCRVYNNLLLAIHVAENIFELQPENAALYVLLSNICSMLLELEDDPKVEKEKDLRDSSIFIGDGGGNFYMDNKTSFGVDAILHAKLHRLYGKLEMIIPL